MQRVPDNELYHFPSERNKGIIGTVIFHIALLGILAFTGFHTPLPLPEEEGILVNFGYDETGSGLVEPESSSSISATESGETVPVEEAVSIPDDVTSVQANLTQEFEEAPEVVKQPDPEAEKRRKQAIEEERIRQEQLEAERVKRLEAEAEQARIKAEADRKAKEAAEQEARRTEIINRTRNALSNSAGTGTATSQGVAGGEGNQGVETGAVNAKNYGDGAGTGTRGISFDLAGRQPTNLPNPTYDIQSEGIVVVEVTVDRNGNVTNAVPGVKGSTTLEEYFLRVAKEAALLAKFDSKPDAPLFQKGTITYHFILR